MKMCFYLFLLQGSALAMLLQSDDAIGAEIQLVLPARPAGKAIMNRKMQEKWMFWIDWKGTLG